MYSIISANPDVEAAVSWVSTTGERIGDVFNDVGGSIENAASSTWNAVSNIGSDFVNGVESGWDTFKSWW
jgi:phage-related protein